MKQTELGLIPDDWETITFGDKVDILRGGSPRPIENYLTQNADGVNWIKIGDVNPNDKYINKTEERIITEGKKHSREVKKGDFILSNSMSFGRPYILNIDGCIHDGWLTIQKYSESFDKEYLYYLLSSEQVFYQYKTMAAGSSVQNLNKEKVADLKLQLPPLNEQKKIAEALSDIDSLICGIEEEIEKKKKIKIGAMQELLTGKRRLPGFAKTDKTKITELGEIPEDWEVRNIGSFANVFDGTHQTPNYVETGVPFYSVENVSSNDFQHTKFITQQEHNFLTRKVKINKGDILMTRIGSIGVCKYVDWEPNASFYVSLALLKCDNTVDARFIALYSTTAQFKKELEQRSLFYAIPQKINLGPISEIELTIPSSTEEQSAIATILSDMDEGINELTIKLSKYKKIKEGMMQQLLTGKIRLVN